MRIRLAIPDHLVTPAVLEAALEATSLADAEAVKRGEVPTLHEAISDGVKWKPEPFIDGEHFDLAHQVVRRGWGDCDDLAPWLAGTLRATGEDDGARPRVYQSAKDRWHVVVETSDGKILDPSKWAGMGKRSANVSGVVGAVARPFAHAHSGALCVLPRDGKWWARADLPWANALGHIASHARGRTPEDALNQAVAGAVACGERIDSPLVERLRRAGTLLLSDIDTVGDALGSAYVGEDRDWRKTDPAVIARYALRDRVHSRGAYQLGSRVLRSDADVAAVPDAEAMAFWHSLPKDKRGGFRDKWEDSGKGLFGKIKDVATGPAGFVVNPAMALGAKTATDKRFRGARNMAANAAIPGGAAFANAGDTLLGSLARGKGGAKLPGAQPSGPGVSLPLPMAGEANQQHPTLFYHPAGSIGPVIMRF